VGGPAAPFAVLVVGFAVNRAKLAAELAQERDLAQRETATARRASAFLQDLFRAADPAKADSITARELLDQAVEHTKAELDMALEVFRKVGKKLGILE